MSATNNNKDTDDTTTSFSTYQSTTATTNTTPHVKRARDDDDDDDGPDVQNMNAKSKRAEILHERRQTVLQLIHHANQSKGPAKVLNRLKELYKYKLLPIERVYHLHSFCLPTADEIRDAEFDAKPIVLLLGPYSTGKTTFICHLLGGEFPGVHIGPEPTTDKFMTIVHGTKEGVGCDPETEHDDDGCGGDGIVFPEDVSCHTWSDQKKPWPGKIIKGNTLTVTPELPFASLSRFGSAFLNHFEGSVCSSPLLQNLILVDTPGVLSGEKQRLSRSYDFAKTTKWFADRSDLILCLFDAHKLDISDEFKSVVETILPHNADKIRCVLNKADAVGRNQFVRVYGSLMWSMGKLFDTPEVVRVYTGSYWDEPLVHDDFSDMFEADEWLLMDELMNLPSVSAERKVNAMVKRIRMIKVHVCILGYLSQQMPRFYGQKRIRQKLLDNLEQVFTTVRHQYKLSVGDLPNVKEFRKALEAFDDFGIFPVPDGVTLEVLNHLIREEIPGIIKHVTIKKHMKRAQGNSGDVNGADESEPDKCEKGVPVLTKKVSFSFVILAVLLIVVIATIYVLYVKGYILLLDSPLHAYFTEQS